MAKTLKEKNQMECNKKARKKYKEKNFKYQTVCFKIEEIEAVNTYCEAHGIPKNTLLREAVMLYIGKPIKQHSAEQERKIMDKKLMPLINAILKDTEFLAGGIFQQEEQAMKKYNLTQEEIGNVQTCLYYALNIKDFNDIVNKLKQ